MSPVRVAPEEVLPLTRIKAADIGDRVLVVGDPARAQLVSEMLSDTQPLAANREYVSYRGTYQGVPVTVISHGVGACGAAVVFEEVCRAGARLVIRAGTAGGLQNDVTDGDLLVASAAVRADGLSPTIAPLEYPAIADPAVTVDLQAAAQESDQSVHTGVILTMASFYPSPVLPNEQRMWQTAGVKGVEMELAALYTICGLHGVRCGGVVAIDGNPLKDQDESMENYEPDREEVKRAIHASLVTSLTTLTRLELTE